MNDRITHDPHNDGIDRRGLLKCMAWVGAGVAFTVSGGVLASRLLGGKAAQAAQAADAAKGDFTFVQVSDSHIGFSKAPNKDVAGTLKIAVDKINALPDAPAFLLHTGDLTHLSKPEEFDTVAEILKGAKVGKSLLHAGRTRRVHRRRQALPGALRQGRAGDGLAELRLPGRPLHRPGQRDEPQGRRPRRAGRRTSSTG